MRKEFLKDEPPLPVTKPFVRRCQKYYLLAKKAGKRQMEINLTIESNYHRVLRAVKKLYAELPNEADRTVFEMDRKSDSTSVTGMHDFLTPGFYWNLECDIWGKFWVYFAFYKCPFEEQIRSLIYEEHLTSYIKVKEVHNFKLYYKTVIGCQPQEYISVLKAEEL